ncbi:hypothetical protein BJV78DRAFT_1192368, partial [Lactifluus subvellereus]
AGTRYFRRGVGHDGHDANFNGTEQIATNPSQADLNEAARSAEAPKGIRKPVKEPYECYVAKVSVPNCFV